MKNENRIFSLVFKNYGCKYIWKVMNNQSKNQTFRLYIFHIKNGNE